MGVCCSDNSDARTEIVDNNVIRANNRKQGKYLMQDDIPFEFY